MKRKAPQERQKHLLALKATNSRSSMVMRLMIKIQRRKNAIIQTRILFIFTLL
jgi:hypothetical protein